MPNVVVVSKLGEVSHHNVKNPTFEQLYKRAGSKNGSNFLGLASWHVELDENKYDLIVFGKKQGKSNEVNKYDFPPPIDNQIIYGNIIIIKVGVNISSGNLPDYLQIGVTVPVLDLTAEEWNKIMEHLFGGFEDLGSETSEEMEADEAELIAKEEKEVATLGRTKDGYVKDGFIADSDESEEEEMEEPPLKKTARKKANAVSKKTKKMEVVQVPTNEMTNEERMDVITNERIDMTDELEEEPYIV